MRIGYRRLVRNSQQLIIIIVLLKLINVTFHIFKSGC